jgi:hypothetical protein
MKRVLVNNIVLFFISLVICYHANAQEGIPQSINAGPQKVIIIRHGEKPDAGNNLSCQGQNRALMLPAVLYAKFKTPDYIYVPALRLGKSTNESRMYQTIVPYAVKYNLNINTKFEVTDAAGLARDIMKKQGTIIIVWEHNNIPLIAAAFGIKEDKMKWKGDDFDSIWIITFQNGKATLTKDSENINPSSECK